MPSEKFSFNKYSDEIEIKVEQTISRSQFIITERELKYFLAFFRVVKQTTEYLYDKTGTEVPFDPKFGDYYKTFIEYLRSNNLYDNKDKRLMQLIKFDESLVSCSVIHKRYKDLEIESRGKKLGKVKPKRNQRSFPTELPKKVKEEENQYSRKRNSLLKKLRIERKKLSEALKMEAKQSSVSSHSDNNNSDYEDYE